MSDPELDPMNELFEAARAETPNAAAKAKALASLGLSGAAASTAAGAAAGASVAGKVVAVVLLVGAAFGTGVLVGGQNAAVVVAPQPMVVSVVKEVLVPTPAPLPEPAPEPQRVSPLTPTLSPAGEREEDSLEKELAALDLARTLLRGGDAAGALKAVSAYEKKFPRGTLAPEATLVRLEALLASGQREQAEALAKKFLAKNSSDLLEQRVKRLLDAK